MDWHPLNSVLVTKAKGCVLATLWDQQVVNMKAIRVHMFGGPGVLKLKRDHPIPRAGAGEVLVQVKAIGVNPYEASLRAGLSTSLPDLPYTPGTDCAGLVHDTGPSTSGFKKGDCVFTAQSISGTYAEYALAQASHVYPLPDVLTFQQGAAIGIPYFTAYRALFTRARARPGDTVLVHGASGGVGVATTQMARAYGMTVIGTGSSDEELVTVKQAGAHFAFNHYQEGYVEDIRRAAGGGGIDVIIENAAHFNLDKDLGLVSKAGRIAIVGCQDKIEIDPRQTMSGKRETDILGVRLHSATEQDMTEANAVFQAGIEAGWLRPIIGREFPLQDAEKAHVAIETVGSTRGKMVLIP